MPTGEAQLRPRFRAAFVLTAFFLLIHALSNVHSFIIFEGREGTSAATRELPWQVADLTASKRYHQPTNRSRPYGWREEQEDASGMEETLQEEEAEYGQVEGEEGDDEESDEGSADYVLTLEETADYMSYGIDNLEEDVADFDPEALPFFNESLQNPNRRLITALFDETAYNKNTRPVRNHGKPVRVNISMSLYQLLDVDEKHQSITASIWIVEDWIDEFLDWDPRDFEMINRTTVPSKLIWTPDTHLHNSEVMSRKRTFRQMNAALYTGFWRRDTRRRKRRSGAHVRLMYPTILRISCHMNVRWFPYDQQNCTFILSSWNHDRSAVDYRPTSKQVNTANLINNIEWKILDFSFVRSEEQFQFCDEPWVVMYAHLIIRRKPLYYIVNLALPTMIITVVCVIGFFTPTSSASERNEKIKLATKTMLALSFSLINVCHQMPHASSYTPLLNWYYFGAILIIMAGSYMSAIVQGIHGKKSQLEPLSYKARKFLTQPFFSKYVLELPSTLIELWAEFGIAPPTHGGRRGSGAGLWTSDDESIVPDEVVDRHPMPGSPSRRTSQILSRQSSTESYEERLARVTASIDAAIAAASPLTRRKRGVTWEKRATIVAFSVTARKEHHMWRQRLARRCALEWEYVANIIDRFLLTAFLLFIVFFCSGFLLFDRLFPGASGIHI